MITINKCNDMTDVRANIDRLDSIIVPLLVERAGYIVQAAGFKPTLEDVVVPERIEFIVAKVRAQAEQEGGDPDLMEKLYRAMMDIYIASEAVHWKRLRGVE